MADCLIVLAYNLECMLDNVLVYIEENIKKYLVIIQRKVVVSMLNLVIEHRY